MDYVIRRMRKDEYPLLEEFLLGAIYVPPTFSGTVPRSVIHDDPRCRAAFEGFGSLPNDRALVAEVAGRVVGACWVRTTDEYGHIDSATPSFSISVNEGYRGSGVGSALLRGMLAELAEAGYRRASLSVQKENLALRLYERLGFRIVGYGADESEWLMVRRLHGNVAEGLEFRKLTDGDVAAFANMRVEQLLEEGATETCDLRPALLDYYERHLADGTFVSWIAFAGDRIVATSGMSIVEKPPYFGCPTGRIGLVSSMYVVPELRRGGLARDLLWRVIDEARARGCGTVHITASKMGVPLYESVGFGHNDNFLQLMV